MARTTKSRTPKSKSKTTKPKRKITKKTTRQPAKKVVKNEAKKPSHKRVRKTKKESFELTSEQPTFFYSQDSETGEESLTQNASFTSPDSDTITLVSTQESKTPLTTVKSSDGTSSMSSIQKRAMVVQYYANMGPQKLKKPRKHAVHKKRSSNINSKKSPKRRSRSRS